MAKACERGNLQAALKRVRKNKGSPGSDGMTVEELPRHLPEHWRRLREQLLAGVLANGLETERHEGTPQGGPLSPLLANVLLDEVDKELEKRKHTFVRYADDCDVYVRSRRAGERVMALLRQLYSKLRLPVNEAKSAVDLATKRKILGYSFWVAAGPTVKRRVAGKALATMKERVPARLEGVLPAGGHAGHLRQTGRMDPSPSPSHPPETLEAGQDHLSRASCTGTVPARGCEGGHPGPPVGKFWPCAPARPVDGSRA